MTGIPLSILDLSPISDGQDARTALHQTVDLAQHAEQWGFRRFWIAEHHFVAVASSSPAVLIGQIAAATTHIRVGAAAVQLGHNTPLAVVEAFGTLDAFHPGRIDLGLGRSGQKRREVADSTEPAPVPPWRDVDGLTVPSPFDMSELVRDPRLRAQQSILQQPGAVSPDFADQLDDIMALLEDDFTVGGHDVRAVPGTGAGLTPWIFGSSAGQSAKVAGTLGLPFVASYHITPATALDAVRAYRDAFVPSARLAEPYVVVSADIVVADDSATAHHLASGYGHWVHSIRSGRGAMPYPRPDDCTPLTEAQLELVRDRTATQFVGDADDVADDLETLQRVTGADELVVTSVTHDHDDRLRSHELIAKRWGLPG